MMMLLILMIRSSVDAAAADVIVAARLVSLASRQRVSYLYFTMKQNRIID